MKQVGILGAGPAGCACAYFLQETCSVTLIDASSPLRTILPTGGGRCNLAHAEYDFRELTKFYPRGEKFLLSVFSRFSTCDTLVFFETLGIKTYTQSDNRIFPISNSSKDVRDTFLNKLKGVKIKQEKGLQIESGEKIKLITDKNTYYFDTLVIAIGGHAGYEILKNFGIKIITPYPSLVGLTTQENLKSLAGVSVQNCASKGEIGDILFTHKGISGPIIYKISSIKARDKFPYSFSIDLYPDNIDLQSLMNQNPHKQINNLLSEPMPKRLTDYILTSLKLNTDTKCHRIDGRQRDEILNAIHNFTVTVTGTTPDGEVVTAGGVDLNEINPKTMESKKIKKLYFIGEVIDVDGFCGGFNLQNCWSTAFVAAQSINL